VNGVFHSSVDARSAGNAVGNRTKVVIDPRTHLCSIYLSESLSLWIAGMFFMCLTAFCILCWICACCCMYCGDCFSDCNLCTCLDFDCDCCKRVGGSSFRNLHRTFSRRSKDAIESPELELEKPSPTAMAVIKDLNPNHASSNSTIEVGKRDPSTFTSERDLEEERPETEETAQTTFHTTGSSSTLFTSTAPSSSSLGDGGEGAKEDQDAPPPYQSEDRKPTNFRGLLLSD